MDSRENSLSPKFNELSSEERKRQNMKAIEQDTLLQKRQQPENILQDIEQDEDDTYETRMKKLDNYGITKKIREKILKKRKSHPLSMGCNSVENYLYLNKIHEGSFGIVFRALDKVTGLTYAIKNVKIERNVRGFPFAALREINALLSINHPNVIRMREVVTGSEMDKIYVVMEYMENELKNLMENMEKGFTVSQIKCLMKQLLEAITYMHSKFIIHRDLKTSNILFNKAGILKVCDFGLARKFNPDGRPPSPNVVTLWYRCPELILGQSKYDFSLDMWSVGCIFAEIVLGKPLFPGKGSFDQLELIFRCLGLPTEHSWPGFKNIMRKNQITMKITNQQNRLAEKFEAINSGKDGIILSHLGFDLLSKMLCYDPNRRIKASEALNHPWFREDPVGIQPEEMPKFKAFNTLNRENKRQKEIEKLKKLQVEQEKYEEEELKKQQMMLLEQHQKLDKRD